MTCSISNVYELTPIYPFLSIQNSPVLKPAIQYLTLRSFGAPAVILSMAMQGIFRGTKDAKTPLYATGLHFSLYIEHYFSQLI